MQGFLDSTKGLTMAITGATGSFGKSFLYKCLGEGYFCKILALNRDEYKQYRLRSMLIQKFGADVVNDKVRFWLTDIRDKNRLSSILGEVDYVIHTAALKHINACELNPQEALKTNITGTQNVIEVCSENNVKKVICLSTDKGVEPINFYGCTKLCAEKLVINQSFLPGRCDTSFALVRYGNIMGSSGSVIPFIRRQLEQNIPFPLTDPAMTRLWLTVEQAIELCFFAFHHMNGKEVFVPKLKSLSMAELVRIIAPNLEIEIVGRKPGEKIHEDMISCHEIPRTYLLKGYCYVVLPETHALMPGEVCDINNLTYKKDLKLASFEEYTSDSVERFDKNEFLDLLNSTTCSSEGGF